MNVKFGKVLIVFLFTFLMTSQILNSQNIIDKSNGEIESNYLAYCCELQSILTVNGITKFEVVQYWDKLSSLRMALISVKDNDGFKLEDYVIEENDKIYLLLKNIPKEINSSNNILIGFHFGEKKELLWSKDKLIKLDTFQGTIFMETGDELILSKKGEYVKFDYSFKGHYNCENKELIEVLVEANLNQKIFKKWFKSQARNYFGKLTLDEIKAKSKKSLLISEFKASLKNMMCFNFNSIEIKLE